MLLGMKVRGPRPAGMPTPDQTFQPQPVGDPQPLLPMPEGIPPPSGMPTYDQMPGSLGGLGMGQQQPSNPSATGYGMAPLIASQQRQPPGLTMAQPGQNLGSLGGWWNPQPQQQAGPWNPSPGHMTGMIRG